MLIHPWAMLRALAIDKGAVLYNSRRCIVVSMLSVPLERLPWCCTTRITQHAPSHPCLPEKPWPLGDLRDVKDNDVRHMLSIPRVGVRIGSISGHTYHSMYDVTGVMCEHSWQVWQASVEMLGTSHLCLADFIDPQFWNSASKTQPPIFQATAQRYCMMCHHARVSLYRSHVHL